MTRFARWIAAAAALVVLGWSPLAVSAVALPGDMSLGNPKAKIEVVEYASLSCPHCAHFNAEVFPAFKAKYIDTGRVHFTMREFITPPGNVAAAGWMLARCAGPAKYFSVVDGVFKSQAQWVEGADIRGILLKVANANGVTEPQFEACLKDPANLKALETRVQNAIDVQKVDSTPTIEINGQRMDTVPTFAELDAALIAASKKKKGGR